METSDDFLTGGGGGVKIPDTRNAREKSTNLSRTAEPLEQVSEAGRKRRRRRAFAATQGFGAPQLGIPGLTGVQ